MEQDVWDDTVMEWIDQMDARPGRVVKSKASSVEKLRKQGYSDEQIEQLLNVRL